MLILDLGLQVALTAQSRVRVCEVGCVKRAAAELALLRSKCYFMVDAASWLARVTANSSWLMPATLRCSALAAWLKLLCCTG